METVYIIFVASFTTLLTNSLWLIIKNKIDEKKSNVDSLKEKKRDSMKKMLDLHSNYLLPYGMENDEMLISYLDSTKSMLMWSSDEVLSHYIKWFLDTYPQAIDRVSESEISFGKVILEMRKEIGYKNKNQLLSAKKTTALFKAGIMKNIK